MGLFKLQMSTGYSHEESHYSVFQGALLLAFHVLSSPKIQPDRMS
jgi:hypothetical protein